MAQADHDLLFGILALQNGLIDQADLIAAFQLWSKDRSRPLGLVLVDRGAMVEADRSMLLSLVARHIAKHGGDTEKSLEAVGGLSKAASTLKTLADPDLNATLAHLSGSSRVRPERTEREPADLEATRSRDERGSTSDSGRFRILRPHARGAIGAVSVALDSELHREVALKEIQEDHADDPQSRSRFRIEAEVTGRLEHPGVVPVYALGTDGKGRPYYAMRFVRGESLREAIDGFHKADEDPARDPAERAVALRNLLGRFGDVCNAISYAHSRGVLHRDIKPANILLGPYGETLVVDWGLAKVVGRDDPVVSSEATIRPDATSGSSETQAGSVVGTPAYMSPEQAEGRLEQLGPATDVYSLGATLYVLLTGKRAVEGSNLAEVLRAVQRGDFPPPSRANRRVPKALEAVVLKAMANRPADRYPSALDLAADIDLWLADEAVSAWREPLRIRARRWASRRRTLVTVAVAAIFLAAVASTAAAWFTAQSLTRESRALAAMTNAKEEETKALSDARRYANETYNIVDTFLTRVGSDLQYVPGAQKIRLRLLEDAAAFFAMRAKSEAENDLLGRPPVSTASARSGESWARTCRRSRR